MTADVNVIEKVRQAVAGKCISDAAADAATDAALTALADPEVLAGIAGVLREHGFLLPNASGIPLVCRCGDAVDDHADHQATALAEWLNRRP